MQRRRPNLRALLLVLCAGAAVDQACAKQLNRLLLKHSQHTVQEVALPQVDRHVWACSRRQLQEATGTNLRFISTGTITGIDIVEVPSGLSSAEMMQLLSSLPGVDFVELDVPVRAYVEAPASALAFPAIVPAVGATHSNSSSAFGSYPDDPEWNQQWGMLTLNLLPRNATLQQPNPGAAGAWVTSTGSKQVVVCIIDTGIDYTHPDLEDNIWTNPGEIPNNGIDDDGNGYVDDVHGWNFLTNTGDVMDDNFHGTHLAGIVGGVCNNSIGVCGINTQVQLMACKFLDANGDGHTSDAVRCLDYAMLMGAHLTLNSYGGVGANTQSLAAAIMQADSVGQMYVTAAGNDYLTDIDQVGVYPADYNYSNVLTVAAVDPTLLLADYSNYGANSVHVAAPGTNIISTALDGEYGNHSGTSQAAAFAAGAVALLLGAYAEASLNITGRSIIIKDLMLAFGVDVQAQLQGKCSTGGTIDVGKAMALVPRYIESWQRSSILLPIVTSSLQQAWFVQNSQVDQLLPESPAAAPVPGTPPPTPSSIPPENPPTPPPTDFLSGYVSQLSTADQLASPGIGEQSLGEQSLPGPGQATAGGGMLGSGRVATQSVSSPAAAQPAWQYQLSEANFTALTFARDVCGNTYGACKDVVDNLPNNASYGSDITSVLLSGSQKVVITLPAAMPVGGVAVEHVTVMADGTLQLAASDAPINSFGAPPAPPSPSDTLVTVQGGTSSDTADTAATTPVAAASSPVVASHAWLVRLSEDLDLQLGGKVSYYYRPDRLVITYEAVYSAFSGSSTTCQAELFYNHNSSAFALPTSTIANAASSSTSSSNGANAEYSSPSPSAPGVLGAGCSSNPQAGWLAPGSVRLSWLGWGFEETVTVGIVSAAVPAATVQNATTLDTCLRPPALEVFMGSVTPGQAVAVSNEGDSQLQLVARVEAGSAELLDPSLWFNAAADYAETFAAAPAACSVSNPAQAPTCVSFGGPSGPLTMLGTSIMPPRFDRQLEMPVLVKATLLREAQCSNHYIIISSSPQPPAYLGGDGSLAFIMSCMGKRLLTLDQQLQSVAACAEYGPHTVTLSVDNGTVTFADDQCQTLSAELLPFFSGPLYLFIGAQCSQQQCQGGAVWTSVQVISGPDAAGNSAAALALPTVTAAAAPLPSSDSNPAVQTASVAAAPSTIVATAPPAAPSPASLQEQARFGAAVAAPQPSAPGQQPLRLLVRRQAPSVNATAFWQDAVSRLIDARSGAVGDSQASGGPATTGGWPAGSPTLLVIQPGSSGSLVLTGTGLNSSQPRAELVLVSNDPAASVVRLPIMQM